MARENEREVPGHSLRTVPANAGQLVPYDPRTQVPDEDDSIDLLEYWHTLVKRRWLILAVLLLFVSAAFFATKLQVPEYRATSTIKVELPRATRILSVADITEGTTWRQQEQFLPTQIQIIKSRALSESLVRREGLADHPQLTGEIRQRSVTGEIRSLLRLMLGFLRPDAGAAARDDAVESASERDPAIGAAARVRAGIEVTPVRNSEVLQLSFISFDPEFAARMANAVVREYTRDSMQRRLQAGIDAREFLEDQLQAMRIEIERADRELTEFARSVGVANLDDNIELARSGLRSLTERLEGVRQDLVELSGWRDLILAGRLDHIDPIANSETIANIRTRLLEASAEYATLSERFLDSYPAVAEVLRRMQLLRSEIEREKRDIANSVIGRFETLTTQEDALTKAISDREQLLMTLNERGVQYNILRREFEASRELYDGILERLKEVGVIAGIQENNVQVIDEARKPGGPFRPNLQKNLAIATMLGLMVGAGLALLLEFLDNTIRRIEDIERMIDRPVLGLVPLFREPTRLPAKTGPPQRDLSHICLTQPKSSVSEAIRSLRTSLMFSSSEGMPRTLLVTSSMQGEGKSTLAANLATVMAQNGSRVLLLDADLRRASLHKSFVLPRSPGLTNCIAQHGEARALEGPAIHQTGVPGLSVMTAGHSTPSPAELLSSSRLIRVLDDCRKLFDYVIVDAPPILGLADAVILSRVVDGVVLVASSGVTGKESFRLSVRRLFQVQASVLGVVLNRVDLESRGYSYYSSYYYHYDSDHQDHGDDAGGGGQREEPAFKKLRRAS